MFPAILDIFAESGQARLAENRLEKLANCRWTSKASSQRTGEKKIAGAAYVSESLLGQAAANIPEKEA